MRRPLRDRLPGRSLGPAFVQEGFGDNAPVPNAPGSNRESSLAVFYGTGRASRAIPGREVFTAVSVHDHETPAEPVTYR